MITYVKQSGNRVIIYVKQSGNRVIIYVKQSGNRVIIYALLSCMHNHCVNPFPKSVRLVTALANSVLFVCLLQAERGKSIVKQEH